MYFCIVKKNNMYIKCVHIFFKTGWKFSFMVLLNYTLFSTVKIKVKLNLKNKDLNAFEWMEELCICF